MDNLRKYGEAPFTVVLVHGGPGAAGEMAPIAKELASDYGVLEPLQTKKTVEGQIEELKAAIEAEGDLPIILVGFSWGAWLSYMLAARYPELVRKLILISSGPFEEEYARNIMKIRMCHFLPEEKVEVFSLMRELENPETEDKDIKFTRLGELISKADAYDPLSYEEEVVDIRYDIYESIWREAEEIRKSGELLAMGSKISCPVLAIHGDYDPHPFEGVEIPLKELLKDFRFILLEKCGHYPWREKQSREKFYEILKTELADK